MSHLHTLHHYLLRSRNYITTCIRLHPGVKVEPYHTTCIHYTNTKSKLYDHLDIHYTNTEE